jgi:molecular chaperone Hsp33
VTDDAGAKHSRAVSSDTRDDRLVPFAVEALDLRGRLVRLGPTVDTILSHYSYPQPVARALGEAVALTALLGSMLESHGRFQLQTRSDGAVDMVVVDYDAPGRLRGFVRFDATRVGPAAPTVELLGIGHMALTIEREEDAARYQGVVALDGGGFAEAAHQYFRQSEQIPWLLSRCLLKSAIKRAAAPCDTGVRHGPNSV